MNIVRSLDSYKHRSRLSFDLFFRLHDEANHSVYIFNHQKAALLPCSFSKPSPSSSSFSYSSFLSHFKELHYSSVEKISPRQRCQVQSSVHTYYYIDKHIRIHIQISLHKLASMFVIQRQQPHILCHQSIAILYVTAQTEQCSIEREKVRERQREVYQLNGRKTKLLLYISPTPSPHIVAEAYVVCTILP